MDYTEHIEAIFTLGNRIGYNCCVNEKPPDGIHILCVGEYISINIELTDQDNLLVYLWVRTTSNQLYGERTDANEIISILLAAFLRVGPMDLSCQLWDVAHPVVVPETEIYARYITLNQPGFLTTRLDEQGMCQLESLFNEIHKFELTFQNYSECNCPAHTENMQSEREDYEYPEESDYYSYRGYVEVWAGEVAKLVGEPLGEDVQFVERKCPSWLHYRSIHTGLTVCHVPLLAGKFYQAAKRNGLWHELSGINASLYISDNTANCIPAIASTRVSQLLKKLHQLNDNDAPVFIPLENYFVSAAGEYLVFAQCDCGKKSFEKEKESIRHRHLKEAEVLFPVIEFMWSSQIDDEAFELLVLDLLTRENGVTRVRKVSVSSERDGGRDLLCDWDTLPLPGQGLKEGASPVTRRHIVVQCKAYQGSVSKAKVQDIRDTVEEHNAHGYFLAVSSYLTSGLTTHLQKMRNEGKLWVDWWTRSEIESRLLKHLDLAIKYSQIITVKRRGDY